MAAPDQPEPQGILAPLTEAAIFLTLCVDPGGEGVVGDLLPDLGGLRRSVGFRAPDAGLSCVVGIGSGLWDRLFADAPRPAGLHPFKELKGERHTAPGPDANDPYVDLAAVAPGWTNDMFVGRDGRAYVGNFGYDLFTEELRTTQLIMVDTDRTVTVEPGELSFPNGMVRRSDGKLVVAETFGPALALFDVGADGHLTPAGKISLDDDLTPDGICIDAEDAIWLASVLSQEVVRVDAAGNAERFALDQNAYACMLGGEDRRTLYVATAPDHEPANRRAASEGRIEAMRVEVPGAGADGIGA